MRLVSTAWVLGDVSLSARGSKLPLVDVVLPGNSTDVIVCENQSEAVSLAAEDPNPAYDEGERLWHLRFRAHHPGIGGASPDPRAARLKPVKVRVSLRIGPDRR